MIIKLISESYWLENDPHDEIYNLGFNYFYRFFIEFTLFFDIVCFGKYFAYKPIPDSLNWWFDQPEF